MSGTVAAARPWRLARPTTQGVLTTITVIICLALFVWPVLMIALGAFREGQPGAGGGWTLVPMRDVLTSEDTVAAVRTSGSLAFVVTLVAKSLSFYFAWLVARTNTPLRRLVTPIMLVVLATPPLFFVLSWGLLGKERVGLLNQWIEAASGAPSTLVNIESFGGLAFVSILKSVAFGYFLLLGPMLALSRRMEEAAAVSGANKVRIFWTVNVPLMGPAFLAALSMGFIKGLEYFEGPLLLGKPAGIDVISTEIYGYLNDQFPPQYSAASGLALIMLLVLVVLLVAQKRLLRGRSFETVGGKAGSDHVWDLGRWRWVGTAVFLLYVTCAVVLPVIQLAIASSQPYLGSKGGNTFGNYRELFADPITVQAMRNTATLSVFAGLAVMFIATAIVFVCRHSGRVSSGLISRSTWLPFAMPGPALALGILWVLLSFSFTRSYYGSFTALFISLVIVAMPVAMRNLEPAVMQVDRDLEEAAWISGSGKPTAFVHVVARLVLPSFLSGWLLSAIIVGGNLTMPLLIGSPLEPSVPRLTYDLYSHGDGPQAAALACVFLSSIAVVYLTVTAASKVLSFLVKSKVSQVSTDRHLPSHAHPKARS